MNDILDNSWGVGLIYSFNYKFLSFLKNSKKLYVYVYVYIYTHTFSFNVNMYIIIDW